ncbi:MAG: CHASE2 domain-containing protein, partial [Cyanobacteria bacterium J083]
MENRRRKLYLRISQIGEICNFELTWNQSNKTSSQLLYPQSLENTRVNWQKSYLQYYGNFRGKEIKKGEIKVNSRQGLLLVTSWEKKLIAELNQWLKSPELANIQKQILKSVTIPSLQPIDLFIASNNVNLAKLPWEAWQITTEPSIDRQINFFRYPIEIQEQVEFNLGSTAQLKVLAVFGDDHNIDLTQDRLTIERLPASCQAKILERQAQQEAGEFIEEVKQALTAQSWDIFFFAGHSEANFSQGGELCIAPGVSITIKELEPQLVQAKRKGLKLAIFNSCNGLSLGEYLISLGIPQAVIMREPIHNQPAQTFLETFLNALTQAKNPYIALEEARQELKKYARKHPCAYLIPSIFRHPDAPLFIFNSQPQSSWIRLLPTKLEAIVLGLLVSLSLLSPLQRFLLEWRGWTQAIYRDITAQVPPKSPPVAVISIDEESIRLNSLVQVQPMDRAYIASLIEQLVANQIKVIGIDYLFDRQQPEKDPILAQTVQNAIAQEKVWFIFASHIDRQNREIGVNSKTKIASPIYSLQGYIGGFSTHFKLPTKTDNCAESCPLAYLAALTATYQASQDNSVQPQLNASKPLQAELLNAIAKISPQDNRLKFLQELRLNPLLAQAQKFGQLWLVPIFDFSIPPDRLYQQIPAHQLLSAQTVPKLIQPSVKVALIAAGGYYDAGGINDSSDKFPLPLAMDYWRMLEPNSHPSADFTGAEAHAYAIAHMLQQKIVIPIPNLWLILATTGLMKILLIYPKQKKWQYKLNQRLIFSAASLSLYSLISWQTYISWGICLPILLPSII